MDKRKNNNESVRKSREKKKKTIEEKTEMYEKLKEETAELEQFLKDKKVELAKIQQTMFNADIVKDFSFVQDDKEIINKFDLKKAQQ